MPLIIPTIYTAIDRMSGVVAKIGAANQAMATSTVIAAARMERSLNAVSASAMAVGRTSLTISAGLIIPLGLATKAAVDFEKQMGNVATLVDTNVESIGLMGDQLLKIAQKVPVSISDLTESLYQIRSAGVGASDAMGVLYQSARLSVAGLSSATDATKAVTSAMVSFKTQGLTAEQIANSFFLTVKEGKTKMDQLNESFGNNAPLVASAKITLQEFNAATAAMTNAGMQASEAQNALKMSVIALKNPTSVMTKMLSQLGVRTGQDLIEKSGGLVNALEAISETAQKAHTDLNQVFHRTAATAVTLLTGNLNQQFKQNLAEQMAGADALSNAFQKQLGTSSAQSQLMANNVRILAINIGTLLLPVLNSLITHVSGIVKPISDWAKNHKVLAGVIFKSVAYIGLAAGAIGVFSLATGTVTKAVWLWRAGLTALNYVIGFSGVLTGRFTMAMYANADIMAGAALATNGFKAALLGLLTPINLILAGLAAIYAYRKEITSAANDNKVGMAYNYAIGDYQTVKESLERNYIKDPSATRKYIEENPKYNSPTIQKSFDKIDKGEDLDNDNDALLKDRNYKRAAQGESGKEVVMHEFRLKLEMPDGKVKTIGSSDMQPALSSTTSYNNAYNS